MIKLEKTDVYGWDAAIRGMRNPMNSWDRSDTDWVVDSDERTGIEFDFYGLNKKVIGDNDYDLMIRLAKGGSVHAKYRRMITVTVDITAPLYWWKEFDTYKVGTVANSCSTMHKIHAKEFTREDFSFDKLAEAEHEIDMCFSDGWVIDTVLIALNCARHQFLATNEKKYWEYMIQLLPSSYNQKRTIQLNYEVLVGMYHDRKNHKLSEWHTFCDWICDLPYSELITGEVTR